MLALEDSYSGRVKSKGDINPFAAKMPGYLANHAARVFNRRVDAALRPHSVSMALLGPMLLLARRGPMLQRDLVRASAVTQPAMVAVLDKLESMRLVERAPDPTDRRAATVHLTREGKVVADRGIAVLRSCNAEAIEGFSAKDAASLTHLLERMISNLEIADSH